MARTAQGQVLAGPFSSEDLPTFEAAITHAMAHYQQVVNPSVFQVIFLHMRLTLCAKVRRWVHLDWTKAHAGSRGVNPLPMSRSTFYDSIAIAKELGIFIENEIGQLAIDYSVRMSDLIELDRVQRYCKKAMPRSWGATEEGRISCATMLDLHLCVSQSTEASCSNSQEQTPSNSQDAGTKPCSIGTGGTRNGSNSAERKNRNPITTSLFGSTASVSTNSHKGRLFSVSKLPQNLLILLRYLLTKTGFLPKSDYNRTSSIYSSDILSSEWAKPERYILMPDRSEIDEQLSRVSDQRKTLFAAKRKRRTLADEVKLFGLAWKKGQKDAGGFAYPVGGPAQIAKLKNSLLRPIRDTDIDGEQFAYWVAKNWAAIGAQHFPKYRKYPEQPAIDFLVHSGCLAKYIEAYLHKDELDDTARLSRSDVAKQAKRYQAATEKLQELAKNLEIERASLIAEREALDPFVEEDDPVYARVKRIAKRKTNFGSYD